jgi:hypothetical protein
MSLPMDDLSDPVARPLRGPRAYPFPDQPVLPWSYADRRLAEARCYWLATARPDGRPHVTPLWGSWVGGRLYLDGPPVTRWARNFTANPAVAVHLESGEEVVILEGVAADVTTDADLGRRIVGDWLGKYGRLAPDPAGDGVWCVTPTTVRGWSSDALDDGTGWTFRHTGQ